METDYLAFTVLAGLAVALLALLLMLAIVED